MAWMTSLFGMGFNAAVSLLVVFCVGASWADTHPEYDAPPKITYLSAAPDVGSVGVNSMFYVHAESSARELEFTVSLAGDLDENKVIDEGDVALIKALLDGSIEPTPVSSRYPEYDVVPDGVIDENDLRYVEEHIGKTFPLGFVRIEHPVSVYCTTSIPARCYFTAVFSWTPAANQTGPYHFMFKVTDPAGQKDARAIPYKVMEIENSPPYFVNLPDAIRGVTGTPLALEVEIRDPDREEQITLGASVHMAGGLGLVLTPALLGGPNYVVDPASGALLYTQVIYKVAWDKPVEGAHALFLAADTDAASPHITPVIRIPVLISPPIENQPPEVYAPGQVEGAVGQQMRFPVTARDEDGSVARLDAEGLPEGAYFLIVTEPYPITGTTSLLNAPGYLTGYFNWLPQEAVDALQVIFCATDDDGARSCASTLITIKPPPNVPPEIRAPASVKSEVNKLMEFEVMASDRDGTVRDVYARNLPEGAVFEKALSIYPVVGEIYLFRWTPAAAVTDHAVTFCAVDDDGAETCARTLITVTPPPNTPPVMKYVMYSRNQVIYWLGFDEEDGYGVHYQYRIDGGGWSLPTKATSIRIKDLPRRSCYLRRYFEVRALDSQDATSEPKGTLFDC